MEQAADRATETPTELGPVLKVIPPEAYENPTWRGVAYVVRDWAVYAAIVAGLIWFDSPFALIPLWILSAFAISGLFILGHDAAHGALFKSKRLNYVLGQLCMLPSLHVYEAWIFGHNRIHHGHTIRETMDYVWHPLTPEQYAALGSLGRLGHRLKWSWLGAGIYYMQEIWFQKMVLFRDPPKKMAEDLARDRKVVGGFFAASLVALLALGAAWYGSVGGAIWMWVKVFAIPLVGFMYSIGIAVYVHHIDETIDWHNRRDWDRFKGQVQGTTIIRLPAWLNFFYHNIFLHVPHHVDMRIPFYGLPAATEAILAHFGEHVRERGYTLREYVATTRACKVFDFEAGRWYDYRGSSRDVPAAS